MISIKPYEKNSKKHPDKQLKQIANSLREFGWRQPIVVDKDEEIIVGHGRWFAYKKFPEGIKDPWIIKADDLTPEQVKAYRLADNKLNESEWDFGLAIEELKELSPEMFDLTGFDKDLLIEPDEKDDILPENAPTVAKLGDLWLLGRHRVLCGDSTDKASVERLMDGKKADMVFTSPPYSDMREYNRDTKKDLSVASLVWFIDAFSTHTDFMVVNLGLQRKNGEIYPYWNNYIDAARESGYKMLAWNVWNKMEAGSIANQTAMFATEHEWIFIFGKETRKLKRTVPNKNAGSKQNHNWNRQKDGTLIHAKTSITQSHHQLGTVLSLSPQKARNIDSSHPAMFPVEFPEKYILAMAEESVIDPFLGSGSTLIAAEKTGRICYGMEIDEHYCDVIIKRWEDYVGGGQRAIKVV